MPNFSVSVSAAETTESTIISSGETRDIVLVLDASGSMRNTPLVKMKEAAIKFCESMLNAEAFKLKEYTAPKSKRVEELQIPAFLRSYSSENSNT